jgi:alpha-beta hydrolase superfamily lysophospholipase
VTTTTLPIRGEARFAATDGTELYERWWLPVRAAKATVLIVHGLGEHIGRYERLATDLNARGYAVFGYDHRGHGRSGGLRGYVESFARLVDDAETFLAHVRLRRPPEPIFVLGHSMGGTVVTTWAVTRPPKVRGVVLSSPGLKVADGFSPLLIKVGHVLAQFAPKVPTQKLSSKFVSRDPAVVAAYEADPLVYHGGVRARTGAEILDAMERIHGQMEQLSLPFLVFHGTEDRLTDCQGSRDLHSRAGAQDKTIHLYDGLYHEALNEPERERVLGDLVSWLDAHV